MKRLLNVAEWCCGAAARRDVVEPLVADWQRELAAAQGWARVTVFMSGGGAYVRTLARCAVSGGWLPTGRAAGAAALAFVAAVALAKVVFLLLALQAGRPLDPASIQTQAYLLYAAILIVPPAMLPALFLLRHDARSTRRHAAGAIVLGAALTGAVVVGTSPEAVNRYFTTFEASEREYQRALANDRAGRFEYPGTAVRQLRPERTLEERRASFERFKAGYEARQAARPSLTWPQRARRAQPVALAVLFGVMGWTLAGLGAVSVRRAGLWWGLMLMAALTFGSTPSALTGLVFPTRAPAWMALPLFAGLTLLILGGTKVPPLRSVRGRD